ncbi:MAG: family oxidoreductase [Chryseobacterium sp.]|jgi:NAD(P)-dependent dehydrogenase (short-subunit alcohol dehydrogenase family)|uniref:SDR family oxidoreductase n=1 Tax=Chryseobacterium sp. 2987 TaxID=2817767 RepID=UPI0028577822|nr:SDR family oxidoreductase [Chryseobacterium sp. 2987]MDF2931119.1 family oxidoreductase [Chryseobacterium sp.]MDR6919931.1 NAD(P)-dependent dehydrogenase (short-subunit alcohol dehydrogenase family) [Chryseobacterium sp. 2987]
MKTIFITGTSSGIGKSTVKLFQQRGWKVIATMRDPEKETELDQLDHVILLPLDVTDLEQIRSTVEKALSLGPIDVVVNNAGYGLMGALESFSDENIVKQVETNFLGTVRVTQAFIPHFRENKNGLFINITSIGGHTSFPFTSIYNGTKWAVEGWSECLSIELSMFGVDVKTVAPSATKTELFNHNSDVTALPYYDSAEEKMLSMIKPDSSPDEIAEVIFEAATDQKDQLRYFAGTKAQAIYDRRQQIGAEASVKEIKKIYFDGL